MAMGNKSEPHKYLISRRQPDVLASNSLSLDQRHSALAVAPHRNSRILILTIATLAALSIIAAPSFADEQNANASLADRSGHGEAVAHISTIDGNAMSNTSGLVRVNITAGDGNVQQNSAATAHSEGYSAAGAKARQYTDMVSTDSEQLLSVGIDDNAFDNALGIVQINNSAGTGNAQFNGAAIAVGGLGAFAFVELNDRQMMDQSSPTAGTVSVDTQPDQTIDARLSPGAFTNASGIIQINQAAGNNNITANSFTMSVSP